MFIATMTYSTKHQEGRPALSLAAERGDVDVMKVLIEGGADVNTRDKVIPVIIILRMNKCNLKLQLATQLLTLGAHYYSSCVCVCVCVCVCYNSTGDIAHFLH